VGEKKRFRSFEPHPLIRNCHAMTIAGLIGRRSLALPRRRPDVSRCKGFSVAGRVSLAGSRRKGVPLPLRSFTGLKAPAIQLLLGIAEKASVRIPVVRLISAIAAIRKNYATLYNSGMSADYRAVLEELAMRWIHADFFRGIFDGRKLGHQDWLGSTEMRPLRCASLRDCPAMDLASCAMRE